MISKILVARHFDKGAKTYDRNAPVQKEMVEDLLAYSSDPSMGNNKQSCGPERILDIGCGTGLLTRALLNRYPGAEITAVDISSEMIKVARKKMEGSPVNWIVADIETMELSGEWDLIVSGACFQWLNNLPETLERLYSCLAPGGRLLFSLFGDKTMPELRAAFSQASKKMGREIRAGQEFYTREELLRLLASVSERFFIEEKLFTELYPSPKDFFYSIKRIGAVNSNREGKLAGRDFLNRVMEIYKANYSRGEHVYATYHAIYGGIEKEAG